VRRYPHIGEYTVPLRVLAVACTMREEALRKRYVMLWERNRSVAEALQAVAERYGTLRSVAGRYGSFTELLRMENIHFAPH